MLAFLPDQVKDPLDFQTKYDMNKERIEAEHKELVKILVKSPDTLMAEFSPLKAAIMHSALGIAGEAIEIKKADMIGDKDNVIEEAGDYLFYHLDLCGIFGIEIADFYREDEKVGGESTPAMICRLCDIKEDDFDNLEMGPGDALLLLSGELVDVCKKIIVYGQPQIAHQDKIFDLLHISLATVAYVLCQNGFAYKVLEFVRHGKRMEETDIDPHLALTMARQHNLDKLAKRYPDGYSDAAAKARADKQAQLDERTAVDEMHDREKDAKDEALGRGMVEESQRNIHGGF